MESKAYFRKFFKGAYLCTTDSIGLLLNNLGYKPKVVWSSWLALKQWQQAIKGTPEPSKGSILIAAIRNSWWMEWAIFSACYFYRMGYKPVIIFSRSEINKVYNDISQHGLFNFWKALKLIPEIQFVDLDNHHPNNEIESLGWSDFAEQKKHLIAAYDLRIEEYEADDENEYSKKLKEAEEMLKNYGVSAERVFSQFFGQRFICPSGLIGISVPLREAANRQNLISVFVEGWSMRPGHMIWNMNRPALDWDIDGWMQILGDWDEGKEKDAQDYMKFREGENIQREGWLDNFHQVQRAKLTDSLPEKVKGFIERPGKFILLGTNVVGDSATLAKATIFYSQHEWLRQVISFIKGKPEINLIVRAHPDEISARARQKMGVSARSIAQNADNVLIIDASEKVNTYSLLEYIDVGLAWVSNIGLDMAVRKKPVLLAAAAPYSNLGLCYTATSQEHYFQIFNQLLEKPQLPSNINIGLGKAYHEILFKLMSLEAVGPHYTTKELLIGEEHDRMDRQKFYQILSGELTDKGQVPYTNAE